MNKSRRFELMVMSYFQRMRPGCRVKSFYTPGTQQNIECFNANGFCGHCNTVFEEVGCFDNYICCQEARQEVHCGTKEEGNG